ncbi:TldD/PmbA family protein [Clostridium felsineum]|uniref:Metalloprotease PmbA n=1 Tax=Clostridium felsineum TaxID=36839 RepID=A0A1S8L4W1_9CLOT|nr:TldD/PmbA family protein [Clostridium felsineum]URZ06674.1 Metalloprotease PmbA [Clostridium felsineum]URZ11707.1 Metalloprotease PmbA [Clostridium felsineum]
MDIREFKEKLIEEATKNNISSYELYYEYISNLNIASYNLDIDNYAISKTFGISFRGIYNGKLGMASTEILDDASINFLINAVIDNALNNDSTEKEVIFNGKNQQYHNVDTFNENLASISAKDRLELCLNLSEKAQNYSYDSKFKLKTVMAEVNYVEKEYGIINSEGLNLNYKSNHESSIIEIVLNKGEETNTDYAYAFYKSKSDLNEDELVEKAIKNTIGRFDGETVASGKYKIVIKNSTFALMLRTFWGIFNGENVNKGISLLKGKLEKAVASNSVTLIDNPLLNAINSKPFDAEGVATKENTIIEKGVLKGLFHNIKSAEEDNTVSTGNASKTKYSSSIGVSPTNLYIEKGNKDFDEIVNNVGEGILINDLQGTHSGANVETGDFSLSAKGTLIEKGKLTKAVEQITISGNFYTLIKNIEEAANDLEFYPPNSTGNFGSPSIVVKEISVSGK